MEPKAYLAGLKQSAWLTKTGQYSTDIKSAMILPLGEALARCRLHRTASNILIPVPVDWMENL